MSLNLPATTCPNPSSDEVKLELIDLGGIHDTADQDVDDDDEDTAEIPESLDPRFQPGSSLQLALRT